MKKMTLLVLAFAFVSTLVAAGLGSAESPGTASEAGDQISVTGCVKKGVEAGCWVLTDAQGNGFSFTGGPAAENTCVEVSGTKTMGFCMQGTQLAIREIVPSESDCCKMK